MLGQAWELAVTVNELQRTGPVAAALAEAAWLHGDHAGVRDIAGPVYQEAVRLGDKVYQAELGYWLTRAGRPAEAGGDHPYAVQAAGRWREAAAVWEAAGCPYEHAAALAESPDPQQLLTALGMLDELGAKPLATVVRGRLRELGVAHIPRGPVGETRVNPAGLTSRQVDVLRLLGKGYTNARDRQPARHFGPHGRQPRRRGARQARRGHPARRRCPRGGARRAVPGTAAEPGTRGPRTTACRARSAASTPGAVWR